jgi:uncharacterized membrane protein HdeD (DUF308 family)
MTTYAETGYVQTPTQARSASGINLLIGIWLIVSPFALQMTPRGTWNNVIFGIVIVLLAAVRLRKPSTSTQAASLFNAAIGVWILISAFLLEFEMRDAVWSNVIAGALVLIFAFWSSAASPLLSGDRAVSSTKRADMRDARTVTDERPPVH